MRYAADADAGNDDKPLKEGWLKKLGHNLQRDWRARYVVLRAGTLEYHKTYEDYQAGRPIASIEIVASFVRTVPGFKGRFELETATKVYTFQARSDAEMQEWVEIISQYIAASVAKITNLLEVRIPRCRPRES